MATNRQRFIFSVNDRMLEEIDQFQTEHHFATRSGAIQELVRLGLESIRKEKQEKELTKKLEVRRTSGRHYILRKE